MPKMLDHFQAMLRGEAPVAPVSQLLGFTLAEVEPGRAVIAFTAGPQHANPMGTLHGGILGDIADAAMGIAFAATLAEDESFTTLELKINFLRPVWGGPLRAVGRVVQRGRTIGLTECDVLDDPAAPRGPRQQHVYDLARR
jgi:uncharacterized protein (TIGR00369 family)